MLDFRTSYYLPVTGAWRGVRVGGGALGYGDSVDCGAEIGVLSGRDLQRALAEYAERTRGGYAPQLAALAYLITGAPEALAGYFPRLGALAPADRARLFALARVVAEHPHFDLRLLDVGRRDVTPDLPGDARMLVAGQVAELFLDRQDLLARLLASPRPFRLYTTPRAFADDGGVAGGCYNGSTGALQLLLARLYEGFYAPTPGVAPFLHEFGHMLDHFDCARATHGPSSGLLPGLRPGDGAGYTPGARAQFLEGKQLELARYLRRCAGETGAGELPIGHPYVFQNDTEFVAGYLELFLRSPHAFARMNPALFQGLATLFDYDPRAAWPADFPFYIDENRRYYASGQRPPAPGLTLP